MSADTSDLSKVDSAVSGLGTSPTETKRAPRKSSSAPGVMNINDLQQDGTKIEIAKDTQKLGWKLNESVNSVDDPGVLKNLLTTPPVKRIDLKFPLGLEVTARNLKGVTIKDALDAIHKVYKKKADDELGEEAYLKGFEWDPEESWTSLKVHLSKNSTAPPAGGSKSKKKKGGDE